MDPAVDQKPNYRLNLFPILINIPNLWLTWFLVEKGLPHINTVSNNGYEILRKAGMVPVYQQYRNLYYTGYSVIFAILGAYIILGSAIRSQNYSKKFTQMPSLIIALIITTFSYAIAGLILDNVRLLQHIVNTTN